MNKMIKRNLIGILSISIVGSGLFLFDNPPNAAVGAEEWQASGIKQAQYQLSGAMSQDWTDLPVSAVTSSGGFDLDFNKKGVTYLVVSTEDKAGNTALDMKVIVIGDMTEKVSPIKKIEYELTGATTQGWTAYTAPFRINQEGVTTINMRVEDMAGNIGTLKREVKLDKTVPINNGIRISFD